jgi:UDP-2,3-diacylglucosamine hydrolase
VGDDDDNPDNLRACAGLTALRASGVPVYALHGNRDFLLGEAFTRRTGVQLLPDPVSIDLYGVRTLLSHGDVFCTEDSSYQELRSIVRKRAWQRRFLSLPLASRRVLANAARAGSKAHTQRTIPTIMDVNPDAVLRAFRATGARRLIHGHTHRPAIHPTVVDGTRAERVVLAPWYEAASCVAVGPTGVREVPLPR